MAKTISINHPSFFTKRNIILIAVVFAALLYANALRNGYNLDDELVTINHRLTSKGISAIPEIFTSPYYQDEMGYSYEYRPVTLATFAIEHQFFGDNATASHVVNILLYLLCIIAFIKAAALIIPSNNAFFLLFSVLLFVAHPLHTEVVASIKNRDEILSLLFALLAFNQGVSFSRDGNFLKLLLVALCLIISLLSKTSAASFLFIIPFVSILLSNYNFKRTVLLIVVVSMVLFLWLFLRDYPLWWALYTVIIMFTLLGIFYLTKNRNIISSILSKLEWIGLHQVNAKDFIIYTILVIACLASLTINSYLFAALLILLLFTNLYLSRKYDFGFLLLTFLIGLSSVFFVTIIYTFLFLSISILLLQKQSKTNRYFWILLHAFIFVVFSSKIIFLTRYDYILTLVALYLLEMAPKHGKWKYIPTATWLVAIIVQTMGLIQESEKIALDNLFFLGFFVLAFFYSLFASPHKKIISLLATLFVVISFSAGLYADKEKLFKASEPETAQVVKSERQPVQKIQSENDKNAVADFASINKEDRPLDFVEFPLGFSPTFSEKAGTVSYVLGYYLKLMVLPYPMCFYYGFNKINVVQLSNLWALLSMVLHLLLGISALYFIRKHPVYSVGVFAYLLSIFLFSNLVSPVAGMIGDRLTFVGSFGFCIASGYALSQFHERISTQSKKLIIAGFSIVLVLYSGLTIARNAQWKDHMTLYKHDIKYLEESAQAHNLLAKRLMLESFQERSSEKQYKMRLEGIKHYEKAIAIYPEFFNPHIDLGKAYLLVDRLEDASRVYLKAAEMDTTYYDSWLQAGGIFVQLQKYPQAIFCFEKVIAKDRSYLQAYISLSEVYFRQKNFDKALEVNMQAVNLFPGTYDPVVNIGKTYFTMGDKNNALIYFEKAYLINPNDRNLVLTIAGIYRDIGEKDKADFYFSRANQIVR